MNSSRRPPRAASCLTLRVSKSADTDVIAAIATPPGRGGIGIVRVSGADLTSYRRGHTSAARWRLAWRRAQLSACAGRRARSGHRTLLPAPASYTGENVLELQGHGGPAVLALVLKRCLDLGARLAEPGEFTKRAFLNDKIDLAQAEAVADLISATTAAGVRAATRSLVGEFSREVHALLDRLVELRVFIEATLDFPEEDVDFIRAADVAGKIQRLQQTLDGLLASLAPGTAPARGPRSRPDRTAQCRQVEPAQSARRRGPCDRDSGCRHDARRDSQQRRGRRAFRCTSSIPRVCSETGRRRRASRHQRGRGRKSSGPIWRCFITDARAPQHAGDTAIVARLHPTLPRVVVRNKIDLAGVQARRSTIDGIAEIWLSAKTGAGVDLLRQAILELCRRGRKYPRRLSRA